MSIYMRQPIHVSGVILNKNNITLTEVGQTEQLIATVLPNDAENQDIVWSSSDETIATVSQTGLVTCVVPGECTITVTTVEGGYTANCSVVAMKYAYVEFLLIGGGGGSGDTSGGGAGGVIQCTNYEINSSSPYSVVIGAAGQKTTDGQQPGSNGGNSCFNDIVAHGGGGGGGYFGSGMGNGQTGGSGGGGGAGSTYGGGNYAGEGNRGGNGCCYSTCSSGGGGGGAGGAGGQGYANQGGYGGLGIESSISGTSQWYAGGGSGISYRCYYYTACCGGTNGLQNASYYGGGGGGSRYGWSGGVGCQGIFILRYPTACGYDITGGTKYTCGNYTIHCFTSNGTLTVN